MNHIAIIPARSGSKRLPGKNTKSFLGTPMIARAILTAKSTNIFDRIIISTDDPDTAGLAIEYGAEAPFIRDAALSGDNVATVPVIKDAILKTKTDENLPEFVTAIYPCTPLLQPEDLIHAFETLKISQASYVFPISEFPSPPERSLSLGAFNEVRSTYPENAWRRTQDFDQKFYDAGQFYCGRVQSWIDEKELHNGSQAIIIPAWRAIDIDNQNDWTTAERYYTGLEAERTKSASD